jgi:BirA family biotin operon repressor/biotin-[acetyl-CoA-carboxylase] ligase
MEHARGAGAVLTVRTVAETGSTNADMLKLARGGLGEGVWLCAERQVAGRGRQGRQWISSHGNLSASTLVRLRPCDPEAATLALVAGVAVQEVASTFLPDVLLKWPNDLLLGASKIAGILLERSGDAVVVGVGMNLAHHPELSDRPTTSLAAQGANLAPEVAADMLDEAFARWLGRWRGEGISPVRARWLERAHPVGTALTARLPDGDAIDGLFDGLEADGALTLRLAGGARRVIHAGDVFLL